MMGAKVPVATIRIASPGSNDHNQQARTRTGCWHPQHKKLMPQLQPNGAKKDHLNSGRIQSSVGRQVRRTAGRIISIGSKERLTIVDSDGPTAVNQEKS